MEGPYVLVLLFGPALLGLGAVIAGLSLIVRRPEDDRRYTWRVFLGSFCLLIALGIGSCYATMFFGRG